MNLVYSLHLVLIDSEIHQESIKAAHINLLDTEWECESDGVGIQISRYFSSFSLSDHLV